MKKCCCGHRQGQHWHQNEHWDEPEFPGCKVDRCRCMIFHTKRTSAKLRKKVAREFNK